MKKILVIDDSDIIPDSSEEKLDALIELADSIRELTDKFSQVKQTLERYEMNLLHTESEGSQVKLKWGSSTLHQWQAFIERVTQKFDTLSLPI